MYRSTPQRRMEGKPSGQCGHGVDVRITGDHSPRPRKATQVIFNLVLGRNALLERGKARTQQTNSYGRGITHKSKL